MLTFFFFPRVLLQASPGSSLRLRRREVRPLRLLEAALLGGIERAQLAAAVGRILTPLRCR